MHEEWEDTLKTAEVNVRLTEAPELTVLKSASSSGTWKIHYRPYRVEVITSWPGAKIGHGHSTVHVFCNEVQWTGEVSQVSTSLLLSDLEVVPGWLADLITAAQARSFA